MGADHLRQIAETISPRFIHTKSLCRHQTRLLQIWGSCQSQIQMAKLMLISKLSPQATAAVALICRICTTTTITLSARVQDNKITWVTTSRCTVWALIWASCQQTKRTNSGTWGCSTKHATRPWASPAVAAIPLRHQVQANRVTLSTRPTISRSSPRFLTHLLAGLAGRLPTSSYQSKWCAQKCSPIDFRNLTDSPNLRWVIQ